MAIVSHLHHRFNPETCQSYIHMLRYVTLERSASPMSSVSEPPCWSLGYVSLPTRPATLPLSRAGLQAHLQ